LRERRRNSDSATPRLKSGQSMDETPQALTERT
jgi:hypothetical protein